MSILIRKMRPEDVESAMVILEKWNMAPVAPSETNKDPERSGLDVEKSFVAIDGERIAGVCSYIVHNPELAETASLAVDPAYRGAGVGYRLQHARLLEMKVLGIRTVHTETDREETIDWYIRKFGYRRIGTNPKKHDFSLPDVDKWVVLRLDLDDYGENDSS